MRVCTLMVLVFIAGCANKEVSISDCIRSAISSENYWEERSMRWLNCSSPYKIGVDQSGLDAVANYFVTNISTQFKCAVPLFVKFSKDLSLKQDRSADRLVDIRNNADYPYCIDMILLGNASALLCNCLYLCYEDKCTNNVVVWSRRLDNIHAWASHYPTLDKQLMNDVGLFNISRRGLCPVFLGDDTCDIEKFLKQSIDGRARLYWWCGQKGLCEGKHIYDSAKFHKWLENWKGFVFPMRVVFSVENTFIFSVDFTQK